MTDYQAVIEKRKATGWGAVRLAQYFGVSKTTAARAIAEGVQSGQIERRERGDNTTKTPEGADAKPDGHGLPESLAVADTDHAPPFVFEGNGRGLVLSDVHIPYHEPAVLSIAVREAKRRSVNHVILLGDIMDCFKISKFPHTNLARSVAGEIAATRDFLAYLRDQFPAARILYKVGNHEKRYEEYIQSNAGELEGLEEVELSSLMHFDRHGVEEVKENQFIHYGHLTLAHGHEFGRAIFSPVNPARGAFLRAHCCALVAHHHQTSFHTEPDLRGVNTSCWSIGCSCQLKPKYAAANKWNHGHAILELHRQNFRVTNNRIIDGEIR